jgi:hypothetical protein
MVLTIGALVSLPKEQYWLDGKADHDMSQYFTLMEAVMEPSLAGGVEVGHQLSVPYWTGMPDLYYMSLPPPLSASTFQPPVAVWVEVISWVRAQRVIISQ